MVYLSFISGFYSALSFASGVFFLASRKRRAPFREAFGWLSLYCAIENLFYFLIGNSEISNITVRESICICADLTTLPLITFVLATIVNQDMKTTPFITRGLRVAILEIPVVVCLGICILTQFEWKKLLTEAMMVIYIVGVILYCTYNLIIYQKRLSNHPKSKEASAKWMWNLVALILIEAVLYFAVGAYINQVTYYIVLCTATSFATYYINKQSPIDTRQLFDNSITQDNDDNDTPVSEPDSPFLSKKDMELKVKQFIAENPHFEKQLAERAVQKITLRDMYLCIMIIEGKHAHEISDILAISETSVEVARYRLRTKLNLNKGENLAKALKACL